MSTDADEAGVGHNSGHLTEASKEKLLATIERIERLEEERKEIADQIKEVYGEAKAFGFDTKALRKCIRIRKMDRAKLEEDQMVLDTYLDAIGELVGALV